MKTPPELFCLRNSNCPPRTMESIHRKTPFLACHPSFMSIGNVVIMEKVITHSLTHSPPHSRWILPYLALGFCNILSARVALAAPSFRSLRPGAMLVLSLFRVWYKYQRLTYKFRGNSQTAVWLLSLHTHLHFGCWQAFGHVIFANYFRGPGN